MVCEEIYRYYFKTGTLSHEELVELCKAADVNEKDPNGYTPLHVAARYSDVKLAEIFLFGGADPNAADNYGSAPLDILAASDHITHRAPPGNIKDDNGMTAAAYMFSYVTALNVRPDVFTENKAQKAMKMIMDAGLDINDTVNENADTLLTCACLSPHRSPGIIS